MMTPGEIEVKALAAFGDALSVEEAAQRPTYAAFMEQIERAARAAIRTAVEAERESCALLVDNHYPNGRASDLDTIAAAIRARTT